MIKSFYKTSRHGWPLLKWDLHYETSMWLNYENTIKWIDNIMSQESKLGPQGYVLAVFQNDISNLKPFATLCLINIDFVVWKIKLHSQNEFNLFAIHVWCIVTTKVWTSHRVLSQHPRCYLTPVFLQCIIRNQFFYTGRLQWMDTD